MKYIKAALFFLSITFTGLLFAHPGHNVDPGFSQGLMHPLSGLDHFIVILLVGFWSFFKLRNFWIGPLIFMLGMTLGVLLGFLSLSIEWLELGISISVIAIGALIFFKQKISSFAGLFLVGIFGIFHGLAHVEFLDFMHKGLFSESVADIGGLLLGTFLLHLLGVGIAKMAKKSISMIGSGVGFITFIYGLFLMFYLI